LVYGFWDGALTVTGIVWIFFFVFVHNFYNSVVLREAGQAIIHKKQDRLTKNKLGLLKKSLPKFFIHATF
jgi:hypothetical protein